MKNKIAYGYIVLGLLCIVDGIDGYSSGWDFKYQQPRSEIGSIALICFGVIILFFKLARFIKSRKNKQ